MTSSGDQHAARAGVFRTPEHRFTALPDYPWAPRYLEHEGLRLAYVDEGSGPAVVLLHGEPTWGYLWRHVLPPLLAAGLRCIVPDLVGFGRSDKPTAVADYSYDGHARAMSAVVEHLDLQGAGLVVHDWGGPIGMRVFVEQPARFGRLAVLDTGFFTGEQRMTEAWQAFRDFVARTEDLPVSFLVDGGSTRALTEGERAAYDAPFPDPASKAGARAFPLMLPTTPEAAGAAAGRVVRDAMAEDRRPKLVLWGAEDPIIPAAAGQRLAELVHAEAFETIPGASHFLQEDAGDTIGRRLATWFGS